MKLVYAFLLFCLSLSATAQNEPQAVSLFETTNDFLYDIKTEALMELRTSGETYFVAKKILDVHSKEKIKGAGISWAIKRGEDYYFNLIYSHDIMTGFFVKLDIIGRYCVAILDKDTYKKAKASAFNPYGGSALGLLANSSTSWNKVVKDSADSKRYLIFIDTKLTEPKDFPRKESSYGNLLTRKKVAEMMKNNNVDGPAKELSFEEVIELIKSENAKEGKI